MDPTAILEQLVALDNARTKNQPAAREHMLIAAQALVSSLQTPSEFIACIGWAEPARSVCVRTAVDLNVFEKLAQHQENGISSRELAGLVNADEELVARIMRHLVATNVIVESSPGQFSNTTLSSQLVEPKYRDGIVYCHDVAGPSFSQLPTYLSNLQYKQPLDPVDGPFQYAHRTKNHFFPWLSENHVYMAAFANYMAGYREGKVPWFAPDFYPVQSRLIDEHEAPSDDGVFLVDVGAGKGHDLIALDSRFTSLPGRLILQDKQEVIASVWSTLPTGITAMSHDFFTPQPIHGARAYFLHSVLHDWDDESCVKILKALKPALKHGYSKILVHDLIVPDTGATWGVTSMDWLMMALGSVRERTEADFRRLFVAAGLKVEKVWIYEPGTEGIIEAVLP